MVSASWYHQINRSGLRKELLLLVCRFRVDNLLPPSGDLNGASQDRVVGPEGGTAIGLTKGSAAVRCTCRSGSVQSSNRSAARAEGLIDLGAEAGVAISSAGGGRAGGSKASRRSSSCSALQILRAADSTLCDRVVLSSDRGCVRDIRRGGGSSKLEDWGFPGVTFKAHFLPFSRL
jgi:hypothetical protein